MEPTIKSQGWFIQAVVCAQPPFGCGQPVTHFKDGLSEKEFAISGLCQHCQDRVFDEEAMLGNDTEETGAF